MAPGTWEAVKVVTPQLSPAPGAFQMATAPLMTVLVGNKRLLGQPLKVGFCVSFVQGSVAVTVTVKVQVLLLLLPSLAV
jgi:hypothetical protein